MQFTEISDALPVGSAYISCCLRSHFLIHSSVFTVLDMEAAQLDEVSVRVENDLGKTAWRLRAGVSDFLLHG